MKKSYFKTKEVIYVECKENKPLPRSWSVIRSEIFERDEICQMCSKSAENTPMSVHHIIPREKGGKHNSENLILLCDNCHDIVEIEKLPSKEAIKNYYRSMYRKAEIEQSGSYNSDTPVSEKIDWIDARLSLFEKKEMQIRVSERLKEFANTLPSKQFQFIDTNPETC